MTVINQFLSHFQLVYIKNFYFIVKYGFEVWDILALGRFEAWDMLSLGVFWIWDVFRLGTF